MSKDIKEVTAPFEVIENQLLTTLDDKSKVAILATREDLDLLISVLRHAPANWGLKRHKMYAGLKQLRSAAFKIKGDEKDLSTNDTNELEEILEIKECGYCQGTGDDKICPIFPCTKCGGLGHIIP